MSTDPRPRLTDGHDLGIAEGDHELVGHAAGRAVRDDVERQRGLDEAQRGPGDAQRAVQPGVILAVDQQVTGRKVLQIGAEGDGPRGVVAGRRCPEQPPLPIEVAARRRARSPASASRGRACCGGARWSGTRP